MRDRDLTTRDLIAAMKVKQPTVSAWLNDRHEIPTGRTLLKFAKWLEVSVDELLANTDDDYDAILAKRDTAALRDVPNEARAFLKLAPQLRRWVLENGPSLFESLQRATQGSGSTRDQMESRRHTKPSTGRRR